MTLQLLLLARCYYAALGCETLIYVAATYCMYVS
jgi:hypothetical protein